MAEVHDATKTITFSLSNFDKPLYFTHDDFISVTGLNYSENYISMPKKETVRAGLETLGLVDEDKPSLSSTTLLNSSPLKMKYFSPIWRIFMQYIVKFPGRMQGSHDQLNLNQQMIAYCLISGLENLMFAIPVADTQHDEEPVATTDTTQSLDASGSAEELRNQPKPANAKEGMIPQIYTT
ncbi:hypothetical protein Tco_1256990 [Tanacetum coccineum]